MTHESNIQGAITQKQLYGEDFHAKIGAKGGAKSKGRKLTAEHKRKISEAQKFRNQVRRVYEDQQPSA